MEDSVGFFAYFWHFFWTVLWIFLLVAWFWVLISVVADIFRSKDLGGFAKAMWLLFVIVIPWLGVLVYVIARGGKMEEHNIAAAKQYEQAQKDYIRNVATVSPAEEIEKLAALKEKGVITEEEFAAQKQKALGN